MTPAPEQPKRRGRPALDEGGRTERLLMRVRAEDKAAWQAQADLDGVTLSAWVEAVLNRSAKAGGRAGHME